MVASSGLHRRRSPRSEKEDDEINVTKSKSFFAPFDGHDGIVREVGVIMNDETVH